MPQPPNMQQMLKQVQKMQQDMVLAATNEALRAAQELQQTRLGGLAGGMDLGSLGLPGF